MPEDTVTSNALAHEVARRRTFAIISHPDAGKTTLTEKLLLYGGAIDLAGAVRSRKNQRHATSDWMALERERGISITTAALQFDVRGIRLNLLDTPGHQDFSEDTYRTLMAVDSAVMVIDGAKGIENQTKKLFEVCRLRHIPILTFINKMDAPARDPFALMEEIESVLGLDATPMNWPVGEAPHFMGLFDFRQGELLRFERTNHGQTRAALKGVDIHDPRLAQWMGHESHRQLLETAELFSVAGTPFDVERYLAGEQTPLYFGSALNNYGIDAFLDALLTFAPPPGPRVAKTETVDPQSDRFSGFVFKIQANMDPQHRDQVAFLRVCSGRFERGMAVRHARTGKTVRLNRPHRLFGGDREVVDEAFPGDVVGLSSKGTFAVGDTLYDGQPVEFETFPRFAPEFFAYLHHDDMTKYKQFHKGLSQLESEGAIQVYHDPGAIRRQPIIAAVGELQFEVVTARLQLEYRVDTRLEPLPYTHCLGVDAPPEAIARIKWPLHDCRCVVDKTGQYVGLFVSEWQMRNCMENNPGIAFTVWN